MDNLAVGLGQAGQFVDSEGLGQADQVVDRVAVGLGFDLREEISTF